MIRTARFFPTVSQRSLAGTARRSARGFSLLEITLVLVIIGILMAVAALNFGVFGGKARVRATKTTIGVVKQALEAYKLENGAYPDTWNTLLASKMLDTSKKNFDAWDRPLRYQIPGRNGQAFDLISTGEDGQPGTPDDISVWNLEDIK